MTYLVTGGAGFLGSHLVEALAKNWSTRVLDVVKRAPDVDLDEILYIQGDVRDYDVVLAAMKSVDVVFHLASLLPPGGRGHYSMDDMYQTNVVGTQNVLRAALESDVDKVVHISSSSVYGIPRGEPFGEDSVKNPIGEYGRSKIEAERLCEEYQSKGLDITVLRPMTILGPRMTGILLILFNWIKNNKQIYTIGDGFNRVQMVSVHDVVDACLLASKRRNRSLEIFNIGSENVPTVMEQIDATIRSANSKSKVMPLSPMPAKLMLAFLSKLSFNVMDPEVYLIADQDHILRIEKAKEVLGWRPKFTNIDAMIEAYDWYVCSDTRPNTSIVLRLLYCFS